MPRIARREYHRGPCKLAGILANDLSSGSLAVGPFLPETRGKSLPENYLTK